MQNVYRVIGIAMLVILALFLLAGCDSGGSGSNSEELRRLAGTNMPQSVQQSTPLPRPTETPDFGNVQPEIAPTPVPQIVEVTREIVREVRVTVEVPIVQESVREVIVTATPQPAPTCDPTIPHLLPLDATDVATGVILRGEGCPQSDGQSTQYVVAP